MYFWTILVLFLTFTCTCYMQPHRGALNNAASRIFLPGQLSRGHISSTSNTSLNIPKKGTGNNLLKKRSQFPISAAFETSGRLPPKSSETSSLEERDMYVPYTQNYTPRIKEFITKTTNEFYARLTEEMQMKILSVLFHYFPEKKGVNGTCDIEETSEAHYYRPSKKGYKQCKSTCSTLNVSYVKLLNKTVHRLSEHLYSGNSNVKLHPINAEVSDCVYNEKKNTYNCECNLNYQITIQKDYYLRMCTSLKCGYYNVYLSPQAYFITALFFLKFLPRTALLYIAFVFYKCNLRWTENDQLATYPDLSFVPPNVEGTVEETTPFPNVNDKLFEKVVEVSMFEEFDINIFVDAFHNFN